MEIERLFFKYQEILYRQLYVLDIFTFDSRKFVIFFSLKRKKEVKLILSKNSQILKLFNKINKWIFNF